MSAAKECLSAGVHEQGWHCWVCGQSGMQVLRKCVAALGRSLVGRSTGSSLSQQSYSLPGGLGVLATSVRLSPLGHLSAHCVCDLTM